MIEIREVRLEDLEAIASLLDQLKEVTTLHAAVEREAVKKNYEIMLRFSETYRSYLAVEDGRIVGLISLVLYKTFLHAGGTALINELVVADGERGRGIGGKLVEAAIKAAGEQGMDEIEVGTETGNTAARRFYERQGFDQQHILLGREL